LLLLALCCWDCRPAANAANRGHEMKEEYEGSELFVLTPFLFKEVFFNPDQLVASYLTLNRVPFVPATFSHPQLPGRIEFVRMINAVQGHALVEVFEQTTR
jgi:hypothetical protein